MRIFLAVFLLAISACASSPKYYGSRLRGQFTQYRGPADSDETHFGATFMGCQMHYLHDPTGVTLENVNACMKDAGYEPVK